MEDINTHLLFTVPHPIMLLELRQWSHQAFIGIDLEGFMVLELANYLEHTYRSSKLADNIHVGMLLTGKEHINAFYW